jgi:hypothetical protein
MQDFEKLYVEVSANLFLLASESEITEVRAVVNILPNV